ncbi:hypothetical protein WMY93_014780 [Mugilogobius chulae]|uniref:Ig-like domain-containing protein n=1 Tax=Mugilogobius chulae TaxID=88201 RepID=A0AAW0NVH9_9GOBI
MFKYETLPVLESSQADRSYRVTEKEQILHLCRFFPVTAKHCCASTLGLLEFLQLDMEHLRFLILLLFLETVASDSVTTFENATVGDDVVLQCDVPEGTVIVLEWKKSEEILLFYRDGKITPRYQDEQFKGRVQLQSPGLENGKLGVILQRVTLQDSGIYTCEAFVQVGSTKQDFTQSIQLSVSEQSSEDKTPVKQALKSLNIDNNNINIRAEPVMQVNEKQETRHENAAPDFTPVTVGLPVSHFKQNWQTWQCCRAKSERAWIKRESERKRRRERESKDPHFEVKVKVNPLTAHYDISKKAVNSAVPGGLKGQSLEG